MLSPQPRYNDHANETLFYRDNSGGSNSGQQQRCRQDNQQHDLENARIVEAITALLIGINRRNKVDHSGIRITGLPPAEPRA